MHLISVDQFDRQSLEKFFYTLDRLADTDFKWEISSPSHLLPRPLNAVAKGKILSTLFAEPDDSRLSYESAMLRLGGSVISAPLRGSVEDTVRTAAHLADIILLQAPDSIHSCVSLSPAPLIADRPVQALQDFCTIKKHRRVDGIRVLVAGETAAASSLMRLLSHYRDVTLLLAGRNRLSEKFVQHLTDKKVKVVEFGSLAKALEVEPHVIHMNRLEIVDGDFSITQEQLRKTPESTLLMSGMPRGGELPKECDEDKRSVYLTGQPINGLAVRLTLIYCIFRGIIPYASWR